MEQLRNNSAQDAPNIPKIQIVQFRGKESIQLGAAWQNERNEEALNLKLDLSKIPQSQSVFRAKVFSNGHYQSKVILQILRQLEFSLKASQENFEEKQIKIRPLYRVVFWHDKEPIEIAQFWANSTTGVLDAQFDLSKLIDKGVDINSPINAFVFPTIGSEALN